MFDDLANMKGTGGHVKKPQVSKASHRLMFQDQLCEIRFTRPLEKEVQKAQLQNEPQGQNMLLLRKYPQESTAKEFFCYDLG